jgi:hypothetical protein
LGQDTQRDEVAQAAAAGVQVGSSGGREQVLLLKQEYQQEQVSRQVPQKKRVGAVVRERAVEVPMGKKRLVSVDGAGLKGCTVGGSRT